MSYFVIQVFGTLFLTDESHLPLEVLRVPEGVISPYPLPEIFYTKNENKKNDILDIFFVEKQIIILIYVSCCIFMQNILRPFHL